MATRVSNATESREQYYLLLNAIKDGANLTSLAIKEQGSAMARVGDNVERLAEAITSLVSGRLSTPPPATNGGAREQLAAFATAEKGSVNWVAIGALVIALGSGLGGLFASFISPLQNDIAALKLADKEIAETAESRLRETHRGVWEKTSANADAIVALRTNVERLNEHQHEIESQIRDLGKFTNEFEQDDETRDAALWKKVFGEPLPRRDFWPAFGRDFGTGAQ